MVFVLILMISFLEVGLLVLFAAFAGILSTRFKVPPVLGLLAIGVLIGPSFLRLITEGEFISAVAELGSMLLLFSIGAEFSLARLKQYGLKALSIGFFKLAIVFWLSYQFSLILGLDSTTSLFVAAILAITSTALTAKLLEQQGLAEREEVPFLAAALIVEDIFAVFALAFFSAMRGQAAIELVSILSSVAVSIAALGIAYFLVLEALRNLFTWMTEFETQETMMFLALAIAVGFSYLAQAVGLTSAIGAFLAGSVVASLPKGRTLEKAISPFTLAFASIFFVSVGMLVNVNAIAQNAWLIAFITLASVLFKFVGTGISTYFNGFSAKSAAFSGAAMLSTGEFSLVIAAQAPNAPIDLVGMTSVIVFVSSIITALAVSKHEAVEKYSRMLMPHFIQVIGRRTAGEIRRFHEAITALPSSVHDSYLNVKKQLAAAILVLAVAAASIFMLADKEVVIGLFSVPGAWLIVLVMLVVLWLPLRALSVDLAVIFEATRKRLKERASISNSVLLLALFSLALFGPFLLPSIQLSPWLREAALLLIGVLILAHLARMSPEFKEPSPLFFKDAKWGKPSSAPTRRRRRR
ncbi:cation:proton antiporter [Candidatus Micrarchaeota archaeon]|nr:cation:proton antiporter [Candidatus Micrarchaeota archaeon]